jgi:hypothetical protein
MTQRHKVFMSYHHANDQLYRSQFEKLMQYQFDIMVDRSVQVGDIDPNLNTDYVRQVIRDQYLRDSTVTVVLVGSQTWQRKHVDWEIGSSIRATRLNSRSGLLGIILPTYPRSDMESYNPKTIPPRLADNINCGYAKIYNWSTRPQDVQGWIHEAFLRRGTHQPSNGRQYFARNRTGSQWSN